MTLHSDDAGAGVIDEIDRHFAGMVAGLEPGVLGVRGRFCVELSDAPDSWIIDVGDDVVHLRRDVDAAAPSRLRLSTGDLARTIRDPLHVFVRAWQGGVTVVGDAEAWRRLGRWLFPSDDVESNVHAGLYASLARLVPDERLTFMNLGYRGTVEHPPLPAHLAPWHHCIRLGLHAVEGVRLSNRVVADIGCGRGGLASYFALHHEPDRVIGVDCCAENIDFCIRSHTASNLEFVRASADDLPTADRSVDVVVNIESSHCYPSVDRFLGEVDRVLRPGGMFCVADVFTPESLAAARRDLARTGWTEIRSVDISDRVADSMRHTRGAMSEMFASMVDANTANFGLICSLIDGGNEQMEQRYRDRELIYRSWQFFS